MKVGDTVKLIRYPREVGRVESINPEGTCVVVDFFGSKPTSRGYFQFDPSRAEAWEPATEDDVFDARFLNGVDYDEWWHCRYCCSVGRESNEVDHQHDCPVGEALSLRRALAQRDTALLAEVATFLTDEGYPWTANMIRNGSWRRRS